MSYDSGILSRIADLLTGMYSGTESALIYMCEYTCSQVCGGRGRVGVFTYLYNYIKDNHVEKAKGALTKLVTCPNRWTLTEDA